MVVSLHKDWLNGVSLHELGITFPDFGSFTKTLDKRRPKKARKQDDWWTMGHFERWFTAYPTLKSWHSPAQTEDEFMDRMVTGAVATA